MPQKMFFVSVNHYRILKKRFLVLHCRKFTRKQAAKTILIIGGSESNGCPVFFKLSKLDIVDLVPVK